MSGASGPHCPPASLALKHNQLQLQQSNNNQQQQAPKRGHQRRHSVARLLPDISKLRLLSWLVEASSELISCDIAIMDGVYAKLNRSQESLLFWQSAVHHSSVSQLVPSAPIRAHSNPSKIPPPLPLTPHRTGRQKQQSPQESAGTSSQLQESTGQHSRSAKSAARNHHSLPITNHEVSSITVQQDTSADTDRQRASNSSDDENEHEEDDHGSSTSSSSSGIHGETSLSSSASSAPNSTSSSASEIHTSHQVRLRLNSLAQQQQQPVKTSQTGPSSSAERLTEQIRRTVMQHNYLQSLLVNVIRQHDRQRDLFNQQQLQKQQQQKQQQQQQQQQQTIKLHRIDLAEIADSLDDICLCYCHSSKEHRQRGLAEVDKQLRSKTLPASTSAAATISTTTNSTTTSTKTTTTDSYHTSNNGQDFISVVQKRNATFIKLVQQDVRSIISKSIELIDLIRKEIKLPESIKQKQLMRYFSTSIQLLTSVANYVVPAQDISTFVPDLNENQTALFSLPASDFENLFPCPDEHQVGSIPNTNHCHQHNPQTIWGLPIVSQQRHATTAKSRFNFIKKLLRVKQQRLLRQQSKDRRIYNNKVQNKFRLVMMDLTHFNKSQQLLTTENGVNSLLTSMRNVLEFGLYLTLKLY